MSEKNCDRVQKILRELKTGIAPFAVKTLKDRHANYKSVLRKYQSEDKGNGRSARKQTKHSLDDGTLAGGIDVAGWLRLIDKEWPYFQYDLGEADRAYVNLLRLEGRNPAMHETDLNEFSDDEVVHIAQSATYLLQAVGAKEEAVKTEKIALEYFRLIAERSKESKGKPESANAQQLTTADCPIPHPGSDKATTDAKGQEQESVIARDMEQNVLHEHTEPIKKATTPPDVAVHDNAESRDSSRDHINRRYMLEDSQETPEQVVEREFPRLNEPVIKNEATRENKAIRGFDKPKRSQYKRPKKKRPYTKLPETRQRTSSNSRQRSRPRLRININSNNRQVTYEHGSKDPVSENQNRNLFILVASVISILIVVPLMPELLQANPSAWLLVLILILVIYKAYQRWLEHQEDMKRMEIESQRKSIFQRVKGFFGR